MRPLHERLWLDAIARSQSCSSASGRSLKVDTDLLQKFFCPGIFPTFVFIGNLPTYQRLFRTLIEDWRQHWESIERSQLSLVIPRLALASMRNRC